MSNVSSGSLPLPHLRAVPLTQARVARRPV